jgi:hypothetical protein
MGLYLVVATRDLRAVVSATCNAFYIPFDRLAVVSYQGSADQLARRLDLDRRGGPGLRLGTVMKPHFTGLAAAFALALLTFGLLT